MSMTLQDALNNASSGSKLFDSLTPEQQQLAVNGPVDEKSLRGELATSKHHVQLLAESLGKILIAAGMIRSDLTGMTGPMLIAAADDYAEYLRTCSINQVDQKLIDRIWSALVRPAEDTFYAHSKISYLNGYEHARRDLSKFLSSLSTEGLKNG